MTPPSEEPQDSQQSKGLSVLLPILLRGAWRLKLLVVLGVMLGAGVGVFRGLVTPNQYRSIGKLYVKPGVRDALAPEAVISGSTGARFNMGMREALLNEMQVLTTFALYDKIVARVGVDQLLAPYDPSGAGGGSGSSSTELFHEFQSWWFATDVLPQTDLPVAPRNLASLMVAGSLLIAPEPGTSVILFAYTSHSPQLAKRVVDAALEAAKELHREVFETMTSVAAMEEEAKTEEQSARAAEQRLRDFRVENGIYDYDGRQQGAIEYLNDLHERLDAIAIEIEQRSAEREAVTKARNEAPREREMPGSRTAVPNPVYTSLVQQQAYLQQQQLTLMFETSAAPPEVREKQRAGIAEHLKKVQAEFEHVPMQAFTEPVMEVHPNYARLSERLADLGVQLEGLSAQRKQLTAVRDANLAQLRELEKMAPVVRTLEDEARQKRSKADRIAEGVANVRTVQRLEQLNLSDVQIMHAATLPSNKVAPERSKLVMFGVAGGAAMGLALAGLLTLRDRRVRLRQDLMRLGLPGEAVLAESIGPRIDPSSPLPDSLASARRDIANFWATVPYERRSSDRFRIAVQACGRNADASRTAAALACGLAVHGGEDVVLVACRSDGGWLARRLDLPIEAGWSDVVRGYHTLEQVDRATAVANLAFVASGEIGFSMPHPMATPSFAALLEVLSARHRFVVVELPDIDLEPSTRAVLRVVDAVQLVAQVKTTTKEDVSQAMAAVQAAGARLLGCVVQSQKTLADH